MARRPELVQKSRKWDPGTDWCLERQQRRNEPMTIRAIGTRRVQTRREGCASSQTLQMMNTKTKEAHYKTLQKSNWIMMISRCPIYRKLKNE